MAPRTVRWKGPCPGCGCFWAIVKIHAEEFAGRRLTAAQAVDATVDYVPTGLAHLDFVLGGGLVAGATILFGGPHGSGKSTLWVQACDSLLQRSNKRVLYASAEEAADGMLRICHRAGVTNDRLEIMPKSEAGDVRAILERCRTRKPFLTIFDSLQRLQLEDMPPSSVRDLAIAEMINDYCKRSQMCAVVMNHMNKELDFVGSTKVAHDLDTELVIHAYERRDDGRARALFDRETLEKIELSKVRVLFTGKNRNGESGRKVFFLMTEKGLLPLERKKDDA